MLVGVVNLPCCLPSADALLNQLLGQLAGQQQAAPTMNLQQAQQGPADHLPAGSASDPAAIQALLAQAGLLGGSQPLGAPTGGMSAHSLPTGAGGGLPPSTSLMLSAAGGTAGSERSYGAGPGGALSALSAGSGAASPAQSASVPVPAPSSAAALGGLAQAAAPGSYLGTSPTPTHSSAGAHRAARRGRG